MNAIQKINLERWASKYLDDVTLLVEEGDILYLTVNNRKVGIIAYQKLIPHNQGENALVGFDLMWKGFANKKRTILQRFH